MSDQNNVFLLRKYGDNWTAAHLSLMEYQLKELEAQMMVMQRHVDNIQAQMHSVQLLVNRHSYLYWKPSCEQGTDGEDPLPRHP